MNITYKIGMHPLQSTPQVVCHKSHFVNKKKSISKFSNYRSVFLPVEKLTLIENNNFTPMQVKKAETIASEIKLVLPNGFQCFFPGKIDPYQVKQLLEVLLSC
jgi:hypothetical protein